MNLSNEIEALIRDIQRFPMSTTFDEIVEELENFISAAEQLEKTNEELTEELLELKKEKRCSEENS